MYATAAGQTDAPPSVGREFVDASHGLRGLPARIGKPVGKKKKRHPSASDVRRRIGKPMKGGY